MSLIHWWPLNGDTRDNGTNAGGITSSVTFSNPGKIGRCADLNNYQVDTNVPIRSVMLGECSFSLWIKVPETAYRNVVNSYSYDSEHQLYNTRVIGTGGGYGNSGFSLHLYSNNIYNEGSLTSINLQYGWRDDSEAPFEAGPTISFDTWYHIAITKDSSKKCRMYVNGILWGTYQATNGDIEESYLYLNTGVVYSWGAYINGHSPMSLNDVRVYDHCLSAKEVKEISKGLVLHYNFEDPYIEGTTNLATWDAGGWDNSGSSTRNYNDTSFTIKPCLGSKVISIVRNDAGNGCITFGNMAAGDTRGQVVTASTYVYLDGPQEGGVVYLRSIAHDNTSGDNIVSLGYNGSANPQDWPKNKWIRIVGTGTVQSDETGVYLCTYLANAGEKRAFNGWQVEIKDHATPWVVNGTTRSPGKVYDNSGYGYNGTQVDCFIVEPSDNKSGEYSLRTNTSGYVQLPEIFLDKTFTVSTWCKHLDSFGTWARIFDFGNATSGQNYDIGLATSDTGGTTYIFGRVVGGSLPDRYVDNMDFNWHLFTVVVDYDSIKYYKDGALIDSFTTYGDVGGVLYTLNYLNKSNWAGDGVSNKYYADFKIYATALSADDILAEYNRKASIDKTGKMFAGEVVETNNIPMLALNTTNFTQNDATFLQNNTIAEINGYWLGFEFANRIFEYGEYYHLSFDAQYKSGDLINILGHSANWNPVIWYLDGKLGDTDWGGAPASMTAREQVLLDGKWHHFDIYTRYAHQSDGYGFWIQVNRSSTSANAKVWFTNMSMSKVGSSFDFVKPQITKSGIVKTQNIIEGELNVKFSKTGSICTNDTIEC